MALFGFKPKTDEVLDHWFCIADGLTLSCQEFYDALEVELQNRQIPGLEISQIEYAEGGLLSNKRIYLRMLRERLAIDACAAPFGKVFFFSCRSIYSPAAVRLWHIIVTLLFLYFVASALIKLLGLTFGVIAMVALVVAILETFRNASKLGANDLDIFLLKIPAIGPMYERWFRVETYFREDTRLIYLKLVPELIRKLTEELSGEKGIKLVDQYERAPILGELYKRIPPKNP